MRANELQLFSVGNQNYAGVFRQIENFFMENDELATVLEIYNVDDGALLHTFDVASELGISLSGQPISIIADINQNTHIPSNVSIIVIYCLHNQTLYSVILSFDKNEIPQISVIGKKVLDFKPSKIASARIKNQFRVLVYNSIDDQV